MPRQVLRFFQTRYVPNPDRVEKRNPSAGGPGETARLNIQRVSARVELATGPQLVNVP
jgi:hypothetical protein